MIEFSATPVSGAAEQAAISSSAPAGNEGKANAVRFADSSKQASTGSSILEKLRFLAAMPRRSLLVQNAFALYGVQVGRKLIPLVSIPYLARTLGPAGWGIVAFVIAMGDLIVIFIEFGFNLSATRSVAQNRESSEARGRIIAGVLGAQCLLALGGMGLATIVSRFIPLLRENPGLLAAGLAYALAQGFLPLWYFQGMERIRLAATLEVLAKTAALGGLFLLVHSPGDAWKAVVVQAVSPAISTAVAIGLALRSSSVPAPTWELVREALVTGWPMFLFRSGETLYGAVNAFLLGLFAPATMVGYFASAEKISKAVAGLLNPIREALFPRLSYLTKHNLPQAIKMARTGTILMTAGGAVLSASLYFAAPELIHLLLGGRFAPSEAVLRILSPVPLLLAVTFSAGQLWLLPWGREAIVNRVIFTAALLNVLVSLVLAPRFGHIGMAWTVFSSELFLCCSLLFVMRRLKYDAPL